MAFPSTNITFLGHGNQGAQVGHNSGTIANHFHVPAERPETPPQPSCFVPFRRDPDFVDRGTLLDQIRQRCAAPASRVALVGLGGVGKSQLAIEHCYRTAKQSPDTWVLWAHASNTARLEQTFREIANQVKVRGRKDPQADVFKLVHDWLRDAKNGRWLLVLDNADDAAVLSPTDSSALQQHLSGYIPPSRHGSVLVTSRTKRAARQVVEDSDIIRIEPMHDAAARALLRKKLRGIGEEDDSIAKLATTLDHMPLALVQAAAYIRERAPRCSVRQYLEAYRQSDSRKTSLLNREAGHLRRDAAASNSVLITWQISFDHIRSIRQSAAGLLSLMSFFDRHGIQEALLHQQGSAADDGFDEDVLALRDYSFITVTRDASTFEMHGLVQLATRTWLEGEGQLDRWREQFISNLCAKLPTGKHENWEKCQALFPHARAALAQRPKNRESLEEWALLLYKAAWYAWQQGRAGEAEEMATMSMEVRSEVLGEDNAETLSSMGMVGLARRLGGKYREAEAMNRQTLARKEKVLGHEHPSTLKSMSNLASVLNRQGKYEEAEAMNRQTLARREKVLGHEHPSTLASMSNLASVLDSQGKYEEAEAMNRQTLARKEKVLGHEHPSTLKSMTNLASTYKKQGRWDDAEKLEVQVMETRKRKLGADHPDTMTSMSNLAFTWKELGRGEHAVSLMRELVRLCQHQTEVDYPDSEAALATLARWEMSDPSQKDLSTARSVLVDEDGLYGKAGGARLIIGLDFGTTYSGIAFCTDTAGKSGTEEIILVTQWSSYGSAPNATNEKVPSRISYSPGDVVKYGNEIGHNHKFPVHSCMKLKLDQQTGGLAREMEKLIFDGLGHSNRDVVTLCSDYLNRLREDAEKSMRERLGEATYNLLRKELVVTVPAVWSDGAKDLTLKAIDKAGIRVDKLTLVTEPEAAALFTLKQVMEGPSKAEFRAGDVFVVCDAGGGTVDLISYKIQQSSPLRIEEATVGSGDKCGATFVDKAFLNWLEEWIGPKRFNKIPLAKTRHGSPLLNSFETTKYCFDGKEGGEWTITLPSACGIDDDDDLNIEDRVLTMTTTQMEAIFEPTVKRTVELLDSQIKAVEAAGIGTPKTVLVVGGYGRSPYLYAKIRTHCAAKGIETRKPQHEWSAVVRGAVCCGLDGIGSLEKRVVVSRRARRFYGTSSDPPWDPSKHHPDDHYCDDIDNRERARSQMKWMVRKGDELPVAEPKVITISLFRIIKWQEPAICSGRLFTFDGDEAPARKAEGGPHLQELCCVEADLSALPLSSFDRYMSPKASGFESYWKVRFDLEATFSGTEITWRCLHKGEEKGSVKVEFNE